MLSFLLISTFPELGAIPMSQKRLDHVGIMVRNLEQTISFYTKVVGLELKGRLPHSNGVIELAFLGFNGSDETEVELIQGYSDVLPTEGKVHHFAVSTDDIDGEYERVKALNVPHIDDENRYAAQRTPVLLHPWPGRRVDRVFSTLKRGHPDCLRCTGQNSGGGL